MTTPRPRPRDRSRQREATRRELLQAGLRVVASAGFAGATTAAIARETGKAHGTVFLHFRTREALVAELVAEIGRTMSAALAASDAGSPSMDDVLRAHLGALSGNEALYARLLGEASSLPPAARAHVFALQSGVASRLRAAWERERAGGSVRAIEPAFLANAWLGLVNHYLVHRDLFAPGEQVLARHGDALRAQFLQLIHVEVPRD
jgi:AcrR family transcriptional regulator